MQVVKERTQYSPTQSNSSVAVVRRNSTETTISTTIRRNRKRGQMKFSDPQRENSKRTRFSRKCRNYNAERRRNSNEKCDRNAIRQ
ncbi:GPI inositol-deacylase [Dirofilaria immitis]